MKDKNKLINIIKNKKQITTRFYKKLAADPLFAPILKKLQMYMKGDGRLSLPLLITTIQKLGQKGGNPPPLVLSVTGNGAFAGYNFDFMASEKPASIPIAGEFAAYNFDFLGSDIQQSDSGLFQIKSKVSVQQGCTENTIQLPSQPFAQGGFAEIYNIVNVNVDDKVCKLFFAHHGGLRLKIKENIEKFKTVTNYNQITLTVPENDNDWICNDGRFGYKMTKMDTSLLDLAKTNTNIITFVNEAKAKLQADFIHGDIKLENILTKNDVPYLHDFDGVYVFKDPIIKPVEIYFTPLYAHPLLTFAIDALSGSTDIDLSKANEVWNINMNIALFGVESEVNTKYRNVMQCLLPLNMPGTISQYYNKFDLYALGASLIHTGIYMNNIEMQDKGIEYVNEALVPHSGGGRKKKGGRDVCIQKPLLSKTHDFHAYAKEQVQQKPIDTKESDAFHNAARFKIRYVGKQVTSDKSSFT